MDEQTTVQPDITVYKQLYLKLHDYHFGRITFLELLDKWKEVLQLPTSAQQPLHEQQENS